MTAKSRARMTVAICLFAAAVETVLGCTSTAGLSPGDALLVLFVIGPYLLLARFAWSRREETAASWVLLVSTAVLAAGGLYVFGEDSYQYHTKPEFRRIQRLAVFLVPIVQYGAVSFLWVGEFVWRLYSRRSPTLRSRP